MLTMRVRRLLAKGRVQEAKGLLTQIGSTEQFTNRQLALLGVCEALLSNHGEARSMFLKLLSRQPRSPKVWNNLGNVALLAGDAEQARTCYLMALKQSAFLPDAYLNLALAALEANSPEDALRAHRAYVMYKSIDRWKKFSLLSLGLLLAWALSRLW